ncbi:MAG: GAF domain-containing protein, partial [Deltaproteobacteria bacterium]|nr:GAF domain-containing protein [Deltaproteobacteria bacterium]
MKAGAQDFVLKDHLARLGTVVERELRDAEVRRQRRWAESALEILAEASRLLVETPNYDEVVHRAANLVVPSLADWCIVYALDRDIVTDAVACREGIDRAALVELARRYPPAFDHADPLFGEPLRSRTSKLTSTLSDDALAALARDATQLQLLRTLAPRSLMVIPQVARDRLVGVVVFAAVRPGRYTAADLGIANQIGGRMAIVLENARLSHVREEFMATAIHEIKTPIAVIKTAVQLMQQMSPTQCEQRLPELLTRLDRQCNRLTLLVTDVLEVSRIDLKQMTLARESISLATLIERIVDKLRDVSPRHQLVIARNEPVTIDADPARIEQILIHIIDNAVKYSPAGGKVEIESRRDGDQVVVSVRDRGIGIPRAQQERIFERFHRAHVSTPYEHASSLGVGLYLAHEFVTRHGGRMWFDSQEGEGSTFVFSLPLPRDKAR